jgi:hypothetical protein
LRFVKICDFAKTPSGSASFCLLNLKEHTSLYGSVS